jgi:hypothetical protein
MSVSFDILAQNNPEKPRRRAGFEALESGGQGLFFIRPKLLKIRGERFD